MPAKKSSEKSETTRLAKMKSLCDQLLQEQTRRRAASDVFAQHKKVCLDLQDAKRALLAGYSKSNWDKFQTVEKMYNESVARMEKLNHIKDDGKVNVATIESEIVQEAVKLTR